MPLKDQLHQLIAQGNKSTLLAAPVPAVRIPWGFSAERTADCFLLTAAAETGATAQLGAAHEPEETMPVQVQHQKQDCIPTRQPAVLVPTTAAPTAVAALPSGVTLPSLMLGVPPVVPVAAASVTGLCPVFRPLTDMCKMCIEFHVCPLPDLLACANGCCQRHCCSAAGHLVLEAAM